jgi:hypothetical protein
MSSPLFFNERPRPIGTVAQTGNGSGIKPNDMANFFSAAMIPSLRGRLIIIKAMLSRDRSS